MRLFKYVPIKAAEAILKTNTIGFSRFGFLNDPSDMPYALSEPIDKAAEGLLAGLRAWSKTQIWEKNTAVLSLNRTPTNLLMWAHYADGHHGVVIEFDARTAGFLNEETNMVPAHFGSVIYTSQPDVTSYASTFEEGVVVGQTHHFVSSHYEKWQRLFLVKPLDWAYEEEVRVVKCINGISAASPTNESGTFTIVQLEERGQSRDLHCYHLPDQSIAAVYIGIRTNPTNEERLSCLAGDDRIIPMRRKTNSYGIEPTVGVNDGG